MNVSGHIKRKPSTTTGNKILGTCPIEGSKDAADTLEKGQRRHLSAAVWWHQKLILKNSIIGVLRASQNMAKVKVKEETDLCDGEDAENR